MGVVIHHRHAAMLAQPLEPATHARELAPAPPPPGPARPPIASVAAERGDGVAEIVDPGHPEPEPERAPVAPADRGLGPVGVLRGV